MESQNRRVGPQNEAEIVAFTEGLKALRESATRSQGAFREAFEAISRSSKALSSALTRANATRTTNPHGNPSGLRRELSPVERAARRSKRKAQRKARRAQRKARRAQR